MKITIKVILGAVLGILAFFIFKFVFIFIAESLYEIGVLHEDPARYYVYFNYLFIIGIIWISFFYKHGNGTKRKK